MVSLLAEVTLWDATAHLIMEKYGKYPDEHIAPNRHVREIHKIWIDKKLFGNKRYSTKNIITRCTHCHKVITLNKSGNIRKHLCISNNKIIPLPGRVLFPSL